MTTPRQPDSAACGYITVPGWNDFQHYKDRSPAWIKLHLDLLGNDAWLELSTPDRCLLLTVWMLIGRYGNGRLKSNERWLKGQANARKSSLERLNQAGFIQIHASPVPRRPASPETETETETEKEREGQSENPEGGRRAEEPDRRYSDELEPISITPVALVPPRPHLSTHQGELGDAVDKLLHICHDRDAATPRVIDSIATTLSATHVYDAIEAIKATSPTSPTRYAVRVLKNHQALEA